MFQTVGKGLSRSLWTVVLALLLPSCSLREDPAEVIYFQERTQAASLKWADLFKDEERLSLQPLEEEAGGFRIAKVLVAGNGNLVVPDFKRRCVLFFTPLGEFIQAVGTPGEEPGQIGFLRTLALDSDGDLYLFDLDDHRIHVFDSPDYRFSRSFSLGTYVSSFFLSPADEIFAYYPTDEEVVKKFDAHGNLVAATFRPEREDIATFLSRIQIGGITGLPSGEFLLIHPGDFVVYHYDGDLDLRRVMRSKSPSEWRPRMPDIPDSLSPRAQGPEHKKWWDTHLHIGGIHWLGKGLFAVTVYRTEGESPRSWFLNLYTLQGRVIAEGVPFPSGGRMVGGGDNLIFVATEPALAGDGSITESSLTKFRLRQSAISASE